MRILFITIALTSLGLLFFSCATQKKGTESKSKTENMQDKDGFTTLPSGLKYKITQQGTGVKPNMGDKVDVHYTGKFTNDTVFDSSVKRGQPLQFTIGRGMVIKGWDEGISLLNEGSKATLIVPPHLGYGATARGPIPGNSTLIFDVELVKVTPKIPIVQFDTKGKDTITTASGLKYIIVKQGDGRIPFNGSNITVHYSGYLMDGNMFDSSVERGQPLTFKLGIGQVIKGWDEAFSILKTGTKARLIIPFNLAYGERGFGKLIPPKSNLIFDVELIEYK